MANLPDIHVESVSVVTKVAFDVGLEEGILFAWLCEQLTLPILRNDTSHLIDKRIGVPIKKEEIAEIFPWWTANQVGRILINLKNAGLIKMSGSRLKFHVIGITSTEPQEKPVKAGKAEKEQLTYTLTVDGIQQIFTESQLITKLVTMFKPVNPTYDKFFKQMPHRNALANMLKAYQWDTLVQLLTVMPQTNEMKYWPIITTPLEFERNAPKLMAFIKGEMASQQNDAPDNLF